MANRLPLLAFLLFQAVAVAEPAADACAPLIPAALAARLAIDLPAYQLPSSADLGEARARDIAASGEWPCPLVALGDFDGNGQLDRAILLKAREGTGVRLVAALNNRGQWLLSLSEDWPLPLADSELAPKESGFYQRDDAIKQPVAQLDQLASLQADYTGFTAGKLNGRFAIYAMINSMWQKLTLRDQ